LSNLQGNLPLPLVKKIQTWPLRGLCKNWRICALADGDHEEVDASLFESDEAYARALQEAEDHY
jgi:hypothetical protein